MPAQALPATVGQVAGGHCSRAFDLLRRPALPLPTLHNTKLVGGRAEIAVGTVIAGRPPHGSRRTELPYRALALRHDGKQHRRRRMYDAGVRYPPLNQAMHPFPPHRALLAASRQRSVPVAAHFVAKPCNSPPVAGDTVVLAVTTYYRSQPLAHLWDWVVPASLQLGFHLFELGPQAISRCMPMHHELSLPGPPTAVDETEELERLWFPLSSLLSVLSGVPPKFQQARLVRV